MKYFNNTKSNSILLSACLLISGGLVTSVQAADFPEAGNLSDGSKVWAENCNRCHNMRGPKELRDDQWITTSFHMRVRAGLTGQETRDVITFLLASNTKSVATGSSQVAAVISKGTSGKEIYDKTCIACHGGEGKGAFPGTPDFTSVDGVLTQPDEVLVDHIINGFQSPSSPMAMPPNGGNPNLSTEDVAAVLKYIRETFGK